MHVDIVGAGFSGLIQAFYLLEAGHQVRVYEKNQRVGGLLGSHQESEFLIEQAANAFIANREIERISKIIKVPLEKKQAQARKRYIYHEKQMRRFPLEFKEGLSLLRALFLGRFQLHKVRPLENETLKDWGDRCLGSGVTDKLLEPAMQGVFATGADGLDAGLILGSLLKKTPKGSLSGSVSPSGGMQQWIDGLVKYISEMGGEILFQDYDFGQKQRPVIFAVALSDLKKMASENKISISDNIQKTSCLSLSSAWLGFEKSEFKPEGFGCLFPKKEGFQSLGVLFNHNIFRGRATSGVSETWILGDQKENFSEMSESALLRYLNSDRYQLTGLNETPSHCKVFQWPGRIPQYDCHLGEFIKDYESQNYPFLLVGNYLGDLGLSKIPFLARTNLEKIEGGYFG